MPGDTKVKRHPSGCGWIDVDHPSVTHPVRRMARQARRLSRALGASVVRQGPPHPAQQAAMKRVRARRANTVTTTATTFGYVQNGSAQSMTSLQQRLFNRLTQAQGVSPDDALDMVLNNGYNKAASYGHMRSVGATHSEAKIVVDMNDPSTSLVYGTQRARGLNHTDALGLALK